MKKKLLVIDTETSGLEAEIFSILSLGAVIWEDGQLLDQVELRIWEREPRVDPESMRINRINLDDWKRNGSPPEEAIVTFQEFLKRNFSEVERITIAGHNVAFDISFLKRLYRISGKPFDKRFSHRHIDTASVLGFLQLAGTIDIPNPSLDSGLDFFGINISSEVRHTAVGDAIATGKLLSELVKFVRV